MSRAALHHSPRAIACGRSEVFQNLLLTTLALTSNVLPIGGIADAGRPVRIASPKVEIAQSTFQQRFIAAAVPIGTASEMGDALLLRWRREDFQGRNHVLFGAIATSPNVGTEFNAPPIRLPNGLRAESQGKNLQLFPPVPIPLVSTEVGSRANWFANRRDDVQSLNIPLFAQPAVLVISAELSPRVVTTNNRREDPQAFNIQLFPAVPTSPNVGIENANRAIALGNRKDDARQNLLLFQQTSTPIIGTETSSNARRSIAQRTDQLGSPFGLIQNIASIPIIQNDLSPRPISGRPISAEFLGSPYGLIQQIAVTTPVVTIDFGRPNAITNRRDDISGNEFIFATQPTLIVASIDFSRPTTARRNVDIERGSYQLSFPAASIPIQSVEFSRPIGLTTIKQDLLGSAAILFQSNNPFIGFDYSIPRRIQVNRESAQSANLQLLVQPQTNPLVGMDFSRPATQWRQKSDIASGPYQLTSLVVTVSIANELRTLNTVFESRSVKTTTQSRVVKLN